MLSREYYLGTEKNSTSTLRSEISQGRKGMKQDSRKYKELEKQLGVHGRHARSVKYKKKAVLDTTNHKRQR